MNNWARSIKPAQTLDCVHFNKQTAGSYNTAHMHLNRFCHDPVYIPCWQRWSSGTSLGRKYQEHAESNHCTIPESKEESKTFFSVLTIGLNTLIYPFSDNLF